jgi:sialic acid synthase SpsE
MSTAYAELIRRAEERLFIIAEAGVNHNGDLDTALRLVDAALAAGCDAVKFQTWITEKVYCRKLSVKPDYQVRSTSAAESEFETIKRLELSFDAFKTIKDYCDARGILFFSTPDEADSADFLAAIGVSLMKTASQDVTNTPFLRHVARLGLPVIFSTGASTLSEVAEGLEAIRSENPQVILLHCVSAYPAPVEHMNLAAIPNLSRLLGVPVGLSDHSQGHAVACAAVALGARVFEKHLTLDQAMPGPDHQASLDPGQMRDYCLALRQAHAALGNGVKRIMPSEENTRTAFRRYLVLARDLPAGARIAESDLCFKKVVHGIAPGQMDLVIGAELLRPGQQDEVLAWNMLDLARPAEAERP